MPSRSDLIKSALLPTYVYELYDNEGTLLYVGVASEVRVRLAKHEEEKAWWGEVARLQVRPFGTRADALDAERVAIETRNPKYNITHSAINEPPPPRDRKAERKPRRGVPVYQAEAERGDDMWLLYVPKIDRWTQSRSLDKADGMARDLIATMLEVSADSFDLDVSIKLPDKVTAQLERAERLRDEAREAQAEAAAEVRMAARRLKDNGLTVRDIGMVLGVSYQRAHQLVQC